MAGEYAIVLYYSFLIMSASIWVCGEVLVDVLPNGKMEIAAVIAKQLSVAGLKSAVIEAKL